MLEQSRGIVTAMSKFRKSVWNRVGKMIRWEDHKHAIVGGKEKNREKKKVYQVGRLIERGENLKRKLGL